ncbi:hypothetical protein BSM4216_2174 [Bacillus smithii]|nr:hypothetical protein BSM4216_2174 [Bacillus smithii]
MWKNSLSHLMLHDENPLILKKKNISRISAHRMLKENKI